MTLEDKAREIVDRLLNTTDDFNVDDVVVALRDAYAAGYRTCHEDTKAHPGYIVISDTGYVTGVLPPEARISVRNEALEEAAKVADEEDGYPEGTGSNATDFVNQGRNETAREIATAIRALKGEGT